MNGKIKKQYKLMLKNKKITGKEIIIGSTLIIGLLLILCIPIAKAENMGKLILTSKVNLETANGKGGVDLAWSLENSTDKTFMVYQQKEGEDEWKAISTVDFFKHIEPINILNIYPANTTLNGKEIPEVEFNYATGGHATLKKSAALKVWMEGGTMVENGKTEEFIAYGKNPITNEQALYVTPITTNEMKNNPYQIWDYDIIVFGMWDYNGGINDLMNEEALQEIEKYIKSGKGILVCHDTMNAIDNYQDNYKKRLLRLRKYFNIGIGYNSKNGVPDDLTDQDKQGIWQYASSTVTVKKDGVITNFPYKLELGKQLKVPDMHATCLAAFGDVWMEINSDKSNWESNYTGTGNPKYYLTTYKNTAMIQAGHKNCQYSEDECKVFANTLFYLKQSTTSTSGTDNSAPDLAAPNAPEIKITGYDEDGSANIEMNATDNGSKYSYYAEAHESNNYDKFIVSNTISETVTTGVEKYYYLIDKNEANDFDISNKNVKETTGSIKLTKAEAGTNNKWIHVKAVDRAGNVSSVTNMKILKLTLTSQVDLQAANGKGGVCLNWTSDKNFNTDFKDKTFKAYQKKENDNEWHLVFADKFPASSATDKSTNPTSSTTDESAQDLAAPNAPEIQEIKYEKDENINIKVHATDNGSNYSFYVESQDDYQNLIKSNITSETVTTGVKKYYYVIDNKEENDFAISEANGETNTETITITINNNFGKWIHIKAVDYAGNVSPATNMEILQLILTSKVNLEAANGKGGVDLDWSSIPLTNKFFMVYQKKEGEDEWHSISTFDFDKHIEPIKVLNVYPIYKDNISTVTFTYSDGTSAKLKKSAALKVWMEGGKIGNETFKASGINPKTGEQLIYVTPKSSKEFDDNPEMIWDYDVVMFGTWDTNGTIKDEPKDDSIKVIEEYIKKGYGVLCGHDTIGYKYEGAGLNKLREYFKIKIGNWGAKSGSVKGIDYQNSWGYKSKQVKVTKKGLLTDFPYELPLGTILTVPEAHSCANVAHGSVWMDFVEGRWENGTYNHYEDGGDPIYYLTTNNNTAMIQTGHSNCASTDEERMILTNTLFYLKQRTKVTSTTDNSAQDLAAPNAPEIQNMELTQDENINIQVHSDDNGSSYSFYVEAHDEDDFEKTIISNTTKETVTTGVEKYYYVIDEKEENDFDIKEAQGETETGNIVTDKGDNRKWLHVRAVDKAGNIGDVTTTRIEVIDIKNEVTLEKSAKWIDAENAIAEISLDINAKIEDGSNPIDVIIVQDSSDSMNNRFGTKTRTQWSREILTKFSNNIYNTNPDSRIALATFDNATYTSIKCELTDINDKDNLINAINSYKVTNGQNPPITDYSAGLREAIDIIGRRKELDRDTFIIFISDGKPGKGYEGEEEAAKLKAMENVKIYGIGIGTDTTQSAKIKKICGEENYSEIKSGDDFDKVYSNIFKDILGYSNENTVCTDTISKYFKFVENQDLGEDVTIENNSLKWNVGITKNGNISLKFKVQLNDEYRYSTGYINETYETNEGTAKLTYDERDYKTNYSQKHEKEAVTPVLSYNSIPEVINVAVRGNKITHETEYFGLFTDTTTTKTNIIQSIDYSKTDMTSFAIIPRETYYLYMVDSEGNKLEKSKLLYYNIDSVDGDIEIIKDGFKITNKQNASISQTADEIRPSNVTDDILTVENSQNQLNLGTINNVNLEKSAKWVDAENAVAEISLDINATTKKSRPIDVIIVQDNSLSMKNNSVNGKTRIQWSKEALLDFSNKIYTAAPDSKISLITFTDDKNTYIQCGLVGIEQREELENKIKSMPEYYGTDFSSGLKKAISIVKNKETTNRDTFILFVTDGETDAGSGVKEANILKAMENVKIYGIGIGLPKTSAQKNIKNICGESNYSEIKSGEDFNTVYSNIFKNIVSYTNENIVCTDTISKYFKLAENQSFEENVSIEDNIIRWNAGTMRSGSKTLKFKVQLRDEYRYSNAEINTKYATNDNAVLVYDEHELVTDKKEQYSAEAQTPELNYNFTPEIITIKVSGTNESHGIEYFGLFTDTTTRKTNIVQSINYAEKADNTKFSVVPRETYYLYMVDSEGNKLDNSNLWHYKVTSTVGSIELVKDGMKIINKPDCAITQTPDEIRPANVTDDILTVKNTKNEINFERVWLTISGTVWNDKDKDGKNSGNTDEGMENITVILHSQNAYGDKVSSTKTNENGEYKFERVDVGNQNYVEFKYNGQYYEPTTYKVGNKNESSSGVDNINERRNLNAKFYEICSSPNNYSGGNVYTRRYLEEEEYIDKYGNQTSRKNQFVDDCITSSYTGYNNNNTFYIDYYPMKKEFGENWSDDEINICINQGYINRENVDIAINQDIENVRLKINEKEQNYHYAKRENVYEIKDRLNNYYDKGYSREIYKSDYLYNGENPLEIYVTYRINIKNNSEDIIIAPSEIVNYYDNKYTIREYELKDGNNNIYRNTLSFNENSKYGKESSISGYTTVYITTNDEIQMKANAELNLFLTFSINKENNGLLAINNFKPNIAEINGYKTYYSDTCFAPNAKSERTQQEFANGDIAGIVDYDSVPGNANIARLAERSNLQGVSEESLKNIYKLEDDTDISPIINFTYNNNDGNEFSRIISGNVWEDARNKDSDKSKIGDGILNENSPIEGVIVELIDVKASEKTGKEVIAKILNENNDWEYASKTTNSNGSYEFKGYIPSDYVVKFIYGTQNSQDNNPIKYNGQDYKSTIYYTPSSESNGHTTYDYNNPDSDKYIYNLKQADLDNNPSNYGINEAAKYYSDARDIMSNTAIGNSSEAFYGYENNNRNEGCREYTNNYSNNNGNGVTNKLAQQLQDTTSDTFMIAKSGKIIANIEYDRQESQTSNTGNNNIGDKNYDLSAYYKIDHLDFGIVERPKAQLKVSQRVNHVKLTLANGNVLFDTAGTSTNVLWQRHIYHAPDTQNSYQSTKNYEENLMKIPAVREQNSSKGIVQLTMDKELMHGADLQITYAITVANIGEVDYTSNQFYYSGVKEANDKIATTTAKTLIDYVGFQVDTGVADKVTRNNMQFIAKDNPDWTVSTDNDIKSLLSKEAYNDSKEYTTIITTKDSAKISQAKLVPILASQDTNNIESLFNEDPLHAVSKINGNYKEQESSVAGVELTLTQNITPDSKNDDLTYNNMVEIVKLENTVGRRMAYSVIGNQKPTEKVKEIDADDCQEISIMPPFGQNKIYYGLIMAVSLIIISGIVGTIKILKYKK